MVSSQRRTGTVAAGGFLSTARRGPLLPTAADVPPIRVGFAEMPYAGGPGGAKGIGELPMDGPAPAIVNAITHATGVRVRQVPATPEGLMEALAPSEPQGRGGRT